MAHPTAPSARPESGGGASSFPAVSGTFDPTLTADRAPRLKEAIA
jgi:hypothetical protein